VFSPDGRFLASEGSIGLNHKAIRLWDLANITKYVTLPVGLSIIPRDMTYSPDGSKLAIASFGEIELFHCATGERGPIIQSKGMGRPLAFSPDGKTLATTDSPGAILLTDTETGQLKAQWKIDDYVTCFALSPDGARAVVTSRGLSKLHELAQRIHPILADKCSPLVSDTFLIDGRTGRYLKRFSTATVAAFRPDGKTLVTFSPDDDVVYLWDVPPRPRLSLWLRVLALSAAFALTVFWWRTWRRQRKLAA
jgi:WD40 repeat protein